MSESESGFKWRIRVYEGIDNLSDKECYRTTNTKRDVPAPGEIFELGGRRYEVVAKKPHLIDNWQDYDLPLPTAWVVPV